MAPRKKNTKTPDENTLEARISSGGIIHQRYSSMVRELNSQSAERLNAVALTDGVREYTYRQMFRQWDKYAETFSAMKITGENGSRVGLASLPFAEVIFAMYALNMTGASVSVLMETATLDYRELKKTIRGEGITDLILPDAAIHPDVYSLLKKNRQRLGLRNIILLKVDVRSVSFLPNLQKLGAVSQMFLRQQRDAVYMDALIRKYEATELCACAETCEDAAIILHSSGTVSGIRKPIPFSDSAFNEGAARFLRVPEFRELFEGKAVSVSALTLCACYGSIDQFHLVFVFGGKVVTAPFAIFSPKLFELIEEYEANIAFFGGIELDVAEKARRKADLSSLKFVAMGGSYFSPEKKAQFDEGMRAYGCKIGASLGYGLSEAGGACILADADCTEDSIGRPLPGVKVKVFNEEEGRYYDLTDGEHEGLMLISSPSISSGRIDETVYFTPEIIDGDAYINTYDMVRVTEDGSLCYIGRADKIFVNDSGKSYDAGLVERAIAAQPGIVECGVVGVYCKPKRDTVPVLYVKTDKHGVDSKKTAEDALKNVFVTNAEVEDTNLPHQVVIVEFLPHTPAGKVDTRQILKNPLAGLRLDIEAERSGGKLTGLHFKPGTAVELDVYRIEMDGGDSLNPMDFFGVEMPGKNEDAPSREGRPAPPFMQGLFDRENRPVPPFMEGFFDRENRPTPPFMESRPDWKPPFEGFSPEGFMKAFPFGRPPFEGARRTPFERGEHSAHGGGDPFSGPIGELLRLFFRPSDHDGFYED